jgi:hypothetical protein
METNKSYDKYYVKKHPATGYAIVEDGKPVLGELAKSDCRLEPRHVNTLNKGWENSGVYFKEVVKEINTSDDEDDKIEARLSLEEEATKLGINFRSNIGDDKLQEKINEVKNK